MHNRVRTIVASFLVKDLLISWLQLSLANPGKTKLNEAMRVAACCIGFIALAAGASDAGAAGTNEVLLQRGMYLVESAGACADCHTRRDWKGKFDRARWLQGSKLDYKPARYIPGWADVAPAIAGLPSLRTDELALRYLQTGTNAAGRLSSPPMPQYRFNREDALAILAYLRSLPPPKE